MNYGVSRSSSAAARPPAFCSQNVPRALVKPLLRQTQTAASADEIEYEAASEEDSKRFDKIAAELVNKFAQDLADGGEVVEPETLTGSSVPRNRRLGKIPTACLPKVAIVGRPNVGKSMLFNRIAGTSIAVVYDQPGVTRDRLYTRAFWGTTEFVLIDTGGLMSDATRLPPEIQEAAMQDISAEGLPGAIERQAAAGRAWKKVLLAVNKCENPAKADLQVADFWELGLVPVGLSAISGTGTGDLLDSIIKVLPPPKSTDLELDPDLPLSIAIVGRPNVGKSSLLNSICGEERSIVCDMSGTTRDAVDTEIILPTGQKLSLIDTAGIRKRTKVGTSKDGPEQISVDRALRAMRRSEVVVVVIDGDEGITTQDYRLSELACAEGRAVVVVVNKWDCVDKDLWTVESYTEETKAQLRHVNWATVVCTTANKGQRVDQVLEGILRAGIEHRRRVSTATLNLVMKEAVSWKAPPTQRNSGRKGKIYYCTQAATAPPTFIFFVNDPKLFSDDYKRYMERQLRESIGFPGTPLRLMWRGKPEQDRSVVRVKASTLKKTTSKGGRGGAGGRGGKKKGGEDDFDLEDQTLIRKDPKKDSRRDLAAWSAIAVEATHTFEIAAEKGKRHRASSSTIAANELSEVTWRRILRAPRGCRKKWLVRRASCDCAGGVRSSKQSWSY
eukprot:gene15516-21605_t